MELSEVASEVASLFLMRRDKNWPIIFMRVGTIPLAQSSIPTFWNVIKYLLNVYLI